MSVSQSLISSEITKIDEQKLIGSGSHHDCYEHPDDPALCIKVIHTEDQKKMLRREVSYHQSLLKRNISWSALARYHGAIITNRGIGSVFDVVRDNDGQISQSLHHLLQEQDNELDIDQIAQQINQMIKSFYRQGIVISDLNLRNILVKFDRTQQWQLVLVDGIGHDDFIPLCNISISYARKKIARTWNRNLDRWYGEYEILRNQIISL